MFIGIELVLTLGSQYLYYSISLWLCWQSNVALV